MLEVFEGQGFRLQTSPVDMKTPSVIEVFPHPALLALCDRDYRVPYKVHKTSKYWPDELPSVRRSNLIQQMQAILAALRQEITGIPLAIESRDAETMTMARLKAFEDMIDALVCAWVGIKYLSGEADAYGDESAAIWVPRRGSDAIAQAVRAAST
jgi:predicted RNase H-like nuclease